MIKILFIGDVFGKLGRLTVSKILPSLINEESIDLVIANAENCAHGNGVTRESLEELMHYGVDCFTSGDHIFDKEKQAIECLTSLPLIRPANFSHSAPGQGFLAIPTKNGKNQVGIANLLGRTFMKMAFECPFHKIDEILVNNLLPNKNLSAIIVDIHAEATSEKICLAHYLDGKVSAAIGTHTHVITADARILSKGTAFITDVGMIGAENECIGLKKEGMIETFITQINKPRVLPEKGQAQFNSVLLTINSKTRQAKSIRPIVKSININ